LRPPLSGTEHCPKRPEVKGMTMMVNSIYNGFRYEDLSLDN